MARGELGECAARMRRTRRVWARRVARGDGSRAARVARVLGTFHRMLPLVLLEAHAGSVRASDVARARE